MNNNNRTLLIEIQEALASETTLANCLSNIYVLVNDGAVILAGAVNSKPLKHTANKIVSNIPGVKLKVEALNGDHMKVQVDWANGRAPVHQGA